MRKGRGPGRLASSAFAGLLPEIRLFLRGSVWAGFAPCDSSGKLRVVGVGERHALSGGRLLEIVGGL